MPEISNAVRNVTCHMSNPGEEHWKAMERLVGYVVSKGKDIGLVLRRPRNLVSISECDSDYAKDEGDRKSISGRVNTMGGMITNWSSKKQATVSLSSTEAEYQALSDCAQEAMFTSTLIFEITSISEKAIIYEDNQGAIHLVKNQQVSSRTKHIDVRHHFTRDLQLSGRLEIRFHRSENNPSDILTKNQATQIYEKHGHNIREGLLPCWKEDVRSVRWSSSKEEPDLINVFVSNYVMYPYRE
jgi:hypothetical protein